MAAKRALEAAPPRIPVRASPWQRALLTSTTRLQTKRHACHMTFSGRWLRVRSRERRTRRLPGSANDRRKRAQGIPHGTRPLRWLGVWTTHAALDELHMLESSSHVLPPPLILRNSPSWPLESHASSTESPWTRCHTCSSSGGRLRDDTAAAQHPIALGGGSSGKRFMSPLPSLLGLVLGLRAKRAFL